MTGSADLGNTAQFTLSDNVLYRSRIEIRRILQALAGDSCPVFAEIDDDKLFVSQILSVDPDAGHFVIAYGTEKSINSALFDQPSVEFFSNHQGAHLIFEVAGAADTLHEGQPAIQFRFPRTLILYHRREHPRIPVPSDASLRCIADEGGVMPFEARIIDISLDGMGGMIYEGDISLAEGSVLKGCRIIIPSGEAVIADLRIRYTTTVTLPDGTLAHRAGVRFMQRPEKIEALINIFIQNLGNDAA